MTVYDDLKHLTDDGNAIGNEWLERNGFDVSSLHQWCVEDALDTLATVLPEIEREYGFGRPLPIEAEVGLLAMQTHSGIILGLRLAKELGR